MLNREWARKGDWKGGCEKTHNWVQGTIYICERGEKVGKPVWTETREELTLLFTRAQQAQNDNYKQNIDNIDRNILKLTFRTFDQVQNIDIL